MGRRANRYTVEAGLSLSVYDLVRHARVWPSGNGHVRWTNSRTEEEVGNISFCIALSDPEEAHVRLIYRAGDRPVDERVELERTPCPFGGWRWWFTCPVTRRRCGKLHVAPGGGPFACRQAYRLAYQSSRDGELQSARNRLRRLHARLGAEYCCYDDDMPPRPTGMHQRTYARLAWAIELADFQCTEAEIAEGERFLRRFG